MEQNNNTSNNNPNNSYNGNSSNQHSSSSWQPPSEEHFNGNANGDSQQTSVDYQQMSQMMPQAQHPQPPVIERPQPYSQMIAHSNSHSPPPQRSVSQGSPAPTTTTFTEEEVFVGDLSYFCTEADLQRFFASTGEVVDARIRWSHELRELGHSLMHGFVTFRTAEEANRAVRERDGELFMGRNIRVQPCVGYNNHHGNRRNRNQTGGVHLHISFISNTNITTIVDEQYVRAIFERFGEVGDVTITRHSIDTTTPRQCGYGFVYMTNAEQAHAAMGTLAQFDIDGIRFDSVYSSKEKGKQRTNYAGNASGNNRGGGPPMSGNSNGGRGDRSPFGSDPSGRNGHSRPPRVQPPVMMMTPMAMDNGYPQFPSPCPSPRTHYGGPMDMSPYSNGHSRTPSPHGSLHQQNPYQYPDNGSSAPIVITPVAQSSQVPPNGRRPYHAAQQHHGQQMQQQNLGGQGIPRMQSPQLPPVAYQAFDANGNPLYFTQQPINAMNHMQPTNMPWMDYSQQQAFAPYAFPPQMMVMPPQVIPQQAPQIVPMQGSPAESSGKQQQVSQPQNIGQSVNAQSTPVLPTSMPIQQASNVNGESHQAQSQALSQAQQPTFQPLPMMYTPYMQQQVPFQHAMTQQQQPQSLQLQQQQQQPSGTFYQSESSQDMQYPPNSRR